MISTNANILSQITEIVQNGQSQASIIGQTTKINFYSDEATKLLSIFSGYRFSLFNSINLFVRDI